MKSLSKLLLCLVLLTVSLTVGYVPTQATPVEIPADYSVVVPNVDYTFQCCDLNVEIFYNQNAWIVDLLDCEAYLFEQDICLEDERVTVQGNDTYIEHKSKRHTLRMPCTVYRC